MSWGILGRIFKKKRPKSQVIIIIYFVSIYFKAYFFDFFLNFEKDPPGEKSKNNNKNDSTNAPLTSTRPQKQTKRSPSSSHQPNDSSLASRIKNRSNTDVNNNSTYLKSFGEINPQAIDSDDEYPTKWDLYVLQKLLY